MYESFDFSSLTIQEIPVVGPKGEQYTLREANGKAATDHRNAVMASTQFGPDGKVTGIKDLASVEAKFVAACLWDTQSRNPSVQLVQSWPARVQKQLYEKAKELSNMDDVDTMREAVEKAFARDDAPITHEAMSAWVATLTDKEYRPLVRAFEKKMPAKNS
jgi:hypothetical protein